MAKSSKIGRRRKTAPNNNKKKYYGIFRETTSTVIA
jgi:hypothetical protein